MQRRLQIIGLPQIEVLCHTSAIMRRFQLFHRRRRGLSHRIASAFSRPDRHCNPRGRAWSLKPTRPLKSARVWPVFLRTRYTGGLGESVRFHHATAQSGSRNASFPRQLPNARRGAFGRRWRLRGSRRGDPHQIVQRPGLAADRVGVGVCLPCWHIGSISNARAVALPRLETRLQCQRLPRQCRC